MDDKILEQRAESSEAARCPMTVVMIAHRLSTAQRADTIFVIENGQVVEQGNHRELIEKEHGVYSALVRRQMGPR